MTAQLKKFCQQIELDRTIDIELACNIADGKIGLYLGDAAERRCAASHQRLVRVIAEKRHVYGITTGFGPLANRLVSSENGTTLQQNLVHHLASGVGAPFSWNEARAIVLARLMSIAQGASGASTEAISALLALLNSNLAPVLPSRGTVGASGDLTPLAHMVLCFQGRGSFQCDDGSIIDGLAGLAALGIPPLDLSRRDGLALVNGTSAMTGVAVLNARATQRAIEWSLALTAAMAETMEGRIEAWHGAFGALRPHHGQIKAAKILRHRVFGSQRVTTDFIAERRLDAGDFKVETEAGQDAYTLRCAPQVIGAVWDTATWHDQVVRTELISVTDNPIFPEASDSIALHGGNFMGQHVGLASDALANALVVLAGLTERQIARITDEKLNRGLPAFLHQGPAGLNSGLMGAQVTATALLAEMRTTGAASTQSISTNGANQDVVSMGTIAARHVSEKLARLSEIQAILALSVAQAMDILIEKEPQRPFSQSAQMLHAFIRRYSAKIDSDRPLGPEIELLAKALKQSSINRSGLAGGL
ncbi:MAG: tyrosine ammonia-lyase [Paracoccaceae bacterium]|jgi:tyrosine ammonia-lyase